MSRAVHTPGEHATRTQAPRSHTSQRKKTFVGEGEELERTLLLQRLPSVSCSQRRRAFALHGCSQPFGGTAKLKSPQAQGLPPQQGWGGRGCQLLAGWTLWGSRCCPSPGGDIPHPDERHTSPPALPGCRGLGPGHISSGVDIGKSWASPAAGPLLVLAFLKAPRG